MQHAGPEDLVRAAARAGVRDHRVLDSLRATPREAFVPAGHVDRAYLDVPVPIPHGQVTTQPSLAAKMIEALGLDGSERVLEIGTGLGFQAAVLGRLAARVWSVERFEDLAATARANLAAAGIGNVEVVVGDGSLGLPDQAPYDAVVVAAAYTEVPRPLVEQLGEGGRLVQPIGPGGAEDVLAFRREADGLVREARVTGAHFVRLHGAHGFR
jgi:protein-L-isoaspartate(D-aspartate) O-methyltransferase